MKRGIALLVGTPIGAWGWVAGLSHLATAVVASDRPGFREGGEAQLLADLERVRALGLFAGRGDRADAAPVLNRLLAADRPMDGTTPAWWARPDAFAALEQGKIKSKWWAHPELTETWDVSFLRDWRAFDHWNWSETDPFAAHYAAHPDGCPHVAPIANYSPFVRLARVRLAQGLHRDELAEAAADIEHLALLAYGSDHFVGVMLGMALLRMEERAFDVARKSGRAVPPRAWNSADLDTAKAALLAVPGLFLEAPGSAAVKTLIARAGELPGVCAGLGEAVTVRSLTREFVAHPWPGEPDKSAVVRGLDDALARSGCHIPVARAMWARSQAHCVGDIDAGDAGAFALAIPYARAPVVEVLETVGSANYFGPYGAATPR